MGPKSKDWWTKEEAGGTQPQAQGHPELLDAVGGRKEPSPAASGGSVALGHLDFGTLASGAVREDISVTGSPATCRSPKSWYRGRRAGSGRLPAWLSFSCGGRTPTSSEETQERKASAAARSTAQGWAEAGGHWGP